MRRFSFVGALLLAGSVLSPFGAQAQILGLEGAIESVDCDVSPGNHTITVMTVVVEFTDATPINSPTAALTCATLADPTPLPGRSPLAGFLGGTAIITGTTGPNTADNIIVEPAENVLLGKVTVAATEIDGPISVSGVTVVLLEDARMPGSTSNPGGFGPIDLSTVVLGSDAAVEGYFAGGVLHAFAIEANGDLLGSDEQTVITRARCRDGDRVRVEGSSSASGTINITTVLGLLGTATVDGLGDWSLRKDINFNCPADVTATHAANGSVDTAGF